MKRALPLSYCAAPLSSGRGKFVLSRFRFLNAEQFGTMRANPHTPMKLSLKLLALLLAISLCRQTSAAIFNPNDVASLIRAINTSNTNMEDDTIELATNGTYTLTVINNDTNGLPVIGSDGGHKLVIHGNGATLQRSTAGGTPAFRIFQIGTGADVTIDRLTIMNGNQKLTGGEGGGIDNNHATLTITNSTLSGNSALPAAASTTITPRSRSPTAP